MGIGAHGIHVMVHIAEQDVAVDVGQHHVILPLDGHGVAQNDFDVGDTVQLDIGEGVAIGPLIIVDGHGTCRAQFLGEDGQHRCAAAHVKDILPLEVRLQHQGDDLCRRLVVGRAKRHLGLDDKVELEARVRRMEGSPHAAALVDHHGLVRGLPKLVPQTDVGKRRLVQEGFHGHVVAAFSRAIGFQASILVHERVETHVSQHRRQHVVLDIGRGCGESVFKGLHSSPMCEAWLQIETKSSALSEAPPMRPPSTSGCENSSVAFLALQLPP